MLVNFNVFTLKYILLQQVLLGVTFFKLWVKILNLGGKSLNTKNPKFSLKIAFKCSKMFPMHPKTLSSDSATLKKVTPNRICDKRMYLSVKTLKLTKITKKYMF